MRRSYVQQLGARLVVIAFVWVAARFYLSDFLDEEFSIRDGIMIQAVNAFGLGL